jgi:hypothetical protein
MFSDFTRMVTMQNLFHYGGFRYGRYTGVIEKWKNKRLKMAMASGENGTAGNLIM